MGQEPSHSPEEEVPAELPTDLPEPTEEATLGAGCFWCTESCFLHIHGVRHVVSGYAGGESDNPSYYDVCNGDSGHAEVVRVYFDPKTVTFPQLLDVFWKVHNPMTLNYQDGDSGTHYRSTIMYHSELQRQQALQSIKEA